MNVNESPEGGDVTTPARGEPLTEEQTAVAQLCGRLLADAWRQEQACRAGSAPSPTAPPPGQPRKLPIDNKPKDGL